MRSVHFYKHLVAYDRNSPGSLFLPVYRRKLARLSLLPGHSFRETAALFRLLGVTMRRKVAEQPSQEWEAADALSGRSG